MRKQRAQYIDKSHKRWIIVCITTPLVSMSLTFLTLYILLPTRSTSIVATSLVNTHPQQILSTAPIAGPPVRLQISRINIDTTINPVGLTSTGAMDIAENPDQVAWYQLGVIPGQTGSAVIAGHYGWQEDGSSGIFNNVNLLQPGDIISVYDSAAVRTDFIVRESKLYNASASADQVFKSDDNKAHLNIITCQGTWVDVKNSYSQRLVVFTDLK